MLSESVKIAGTVQAVFGVLSRPRQDEGLIAVVVEGREVRVRVPQSGSEIAANRVFVGEHVEIWGEVLSRGRDGAPDQLRAIVLTHGAMADEDLKRAMKSLPRRVTAWRRFAGPWWLPLLIAGVLMLVAVATGRGMFD